MRDLDMSDVLADAEDMRDQYLNSMFLALDKLGDDELRQARYNRGAEAREGCGDAIMVTRAIDYILLVRIATTLCECCLNITGCDMCCPPDFTDYGIDQADHYERFGRPAFPNEY